MKGIVMIKCLCYNVSTYIINYHCAGSGLLSEEKGV